MQQSRRPWTQQEDSAVLNIVEEIGLKNWPLVSTLMKKNYNIDGRTGKQCRERWHNQLNPEVNKMPWTEQQEKLLFQAHKTYRNRWIDISKLFEGRTDNSIKNHFYSTIRRSLRRICKLLGNKNSTSQLRNIKPSILSKIFEYSQLKGDQVTKQNQLMVQDSKIITEELLNFARSKPSKSIQGLQEQKKKSLQTLINKLNQFSENYNFQKDRNSIFKSPVVKNKKVIIVKADEKQFSMNDESSQFSSPNSFSPSTQLKNKQYIYDWQQFEKRCLFVKQIFENQTQQKSPDMSYQSGDNQSMLKSFENQLQFSLQQKQSERAETYTTPRIFKARGFQPYKGIESQLNFKEDYETIVEKLKAEIVQAAAN